MTQKTFRHRLGTACLNDMIRDPRYMDGADPEHDSVKNAVGRGFRMLFDDGKPHPADSTPAPVSGLFDDAMARIIGPEPSRPRTGHAHPPDGPHRTAPLFHGIVCAV
ncbi:MAG: hypothetical protein ACKVJQ_09095 [Alphaproteobacteria bacterium]